MSNTPYRVLMTSSASHDVLKILRFVALSNQNEASQWYRNVRQRLTSLQSLPNRRSRIPESEQLGQAYLETRLPGSRILYRVEDEVVYILRVIYEAWL